jgi:hypothetical protein
VQGVFFTNITQAEGTSVDVLLDFEGLPSNVIEGIVIDGLHLQGKQAVKCDLVKGTYKDCELCMQCAGLAPAAPEP